MTAETTIAPPATRTESASKPAGADNIVPKKIRILGVPLDLGQTRRGVDMGPSAVRVAGLEARLGGCRSRERKAERGDER